MQAKKKTVIPIWPSTHVRSTKGDRWLFAVTDEYLEEYDQKILTETGKPGGNVRRKRQLDKYNAYKQELRDWAERTGFQMPLGHFAIWFCIPIPPSWRKKKIAANLGKAHQSTPDFDNLLKAFFDAIMPRKSRTRGEKGQDDRKIHCCAPFKVWVGAEEARIEVIEYDPEEYMAVFNDDRLPEDHPPNSL